MTITPKDLAQIVAYMDTEIDETDLPQPDPPPPPDHPLVNASIGRICRELKKRGGLRSPEDFRLKEKMEYSRRYSLDTIRAVIEAYYAKVREIQESMGG